MKTIRFADIDVANAIAHKGKDARTSDKYGNIENYTDRIKVNPYKTRKAKIQKQVVKCAKKINRSKYVRTYITTSTGVVVLNREVRTPQVQKSYPTATMLYWEQPNGIFSNVIKIQSICK